MKRKCSVCEIEKELDEFYKSNIEKLGREYRCKACAHLKYKKYREKKGVEWNEKTKAFQRKKLKEDPDYFRKCYRKYKGKEYNQKYRIQFTEKDRKKVRARRNLNYHLKMGNLEKPETCSLCMLKPKRLEAHHENYDKPKDVIWLCTKCHNKVDRKRRERE